MKLSPFHLLHKVSSPTLNRGFTLLELMVSSVVAIAVLSASMGAINQQRKTFLADRDRINTNDNLRVAMNLIGSDIKQAGERLEQANDKLEFPVVQVINGIPTNPPDRIIVQRKLMAEALTICSNVAPGSTFIEVADAQAGANCNSATPRAITALPNVSRWQAERCEQDSLEGCQSPLNATNCMQTGGSKRECMWGYLYDPVNRRGEFLLIYGEEESACATVSGQRCWRVNLVNAGVKARQFNFAPIPGNLATQPKLYVLDQREYRLSADASTPRPDDRVLELIVNDQDQNSQRLANLIADMQIRVRTGSAATPTWNTSFSPTVIPPSSNRTPDWQTIGGIEVALRSLNPSDNSQLSNAQLTLTSQFFPRNVQSNTQP